MTDLKPCPCGSPKVDYLSGYFTSATDHFREGEKFWRVWCKYCQMRTGPEKTKSAAIATWNTRHITRADIPEALVKEIAWKYFSAGFSIGYDVNADVDFMESHFNRVFKLKEQKR